MALWIVGILGAQALSFACLMLLARHSAVLVDEEGRPVTASADWLERVVPLGQAASRPRPRG